MTATNKTVRVVGPTGATGTLERVNILSSFAGPTGAYPVWAQSATGATGFKTVIGAARLMVDSGFTILDRTDVIPNSSYGGATTYRVQGTAAAINPTLTRPNAQLVARYSSTAIVSFKGSGTWKLVAKAAGVCGSGSPVATLNTTTADLIVIVQYGGTADAPTDSNGNTWTLAKYQPNDFARAEVHVWYCSHPTVGAGHTFTTSPAFNSYSVSAWSGSGALDQTAGGQVQGDGATLTQPAGSITPTASNELIIACFGIDDPSNVLSAGLSDPPGQIKTVIISGYTGPR